MREVEKRGESAGEVAPFACWFDVIFGRVNGREGEKGGGERVE
jgi:hypothetical protein